MRSVRASTLAVYSGASKLTYMTLCAEIVDLSGLHLLNDPLQIAAVAQIAVGLKRGGCPIAQLVWVLVQVIDPGRVEATGPAFDSMLHPFPAEVLPGSLAGDAGDQGVFAVAHAPFSRVALCLMGSAQLAICFMRLPSVTCFTTL